MRSEECNGCDEYSRARADAEFEFQEKLENFTKFLLLKRENSKRMAKEYAGKHSTVKLMKAHYLSEVYAFEEALKWLTFYADLDEEEIKLKLEMGE